MALLSPVSFLEDWLSLLCKTKDIKGIKDIINYHHVPWTNANQSVTHSLTLINRIQAIHIDINNISDTPK